MIAKTRTSLSPAQTSDIIDAIRLARTHGDGALAGAFEQLLGLIESQDHQCRSDRARMQRAEEAAAHLADRVEGLAETVVHLLEQLDALQRDPRLQPFEHGMTPVESVYVGNHLNAVA